MSEFYIAVEADTNDADYVRSFIKLDKNFDINRLKNIIEVLKQNDGTWYTGDLCYKDRDTRLIYKDKLTENDIDMMNSYIPGSDYGIHTITSIEIIEVNNIEKLL